MFAPCKTARGEVKRKSALVTRTGSASGRMLDVTTRLACYKRMAFTFLLTGNQTEKTVFAMTALFSMKKR
jgi:hypothetical protein